MNAPRPPFDAHGCTPEPAASLNELQSRYQDRMRAAGAPDPIKGPETPLDEQIAQHMANNAIGMARRPAEPALFDAKRFATAQAKAALAGFELVAMPGGGFVSSKWGHVRALATMDDVDAFLRLVGAA